MSMQFRRHRLCARRMPRSAFVSALLVASSAVRAAPAVDTVDAVADTLVVDATRVTAEEIIADAGRHLRDARNDLHSLEYTALVTTVRGHEPADAQDSWQVEEIAFRVRHDQGQPDRVVRVARRVVEVEAGRPGPPKLEPAGEPAWMPRPAELVTDMPFVPGSAGRYRYDVLENRLVGESVVYRIAFEPRSRFDALPSGVIWVDVSDWGVRRVEARFDGALPYPWILRAIPLYRLRQNLCGGVWLPVHEQARLDLRRLPFMSPETAVEVRVVMRDIMVDGEPCDCDAPMSAADDSLNSYWTAIDRLWDADASTPLRTTMFATADADSLSRLGADLLASMPARPPWRLRPRPMLPAFNRVQGGVVRAGVTFQRVGTVSRLKAGAGWGLADRRAEWTLNGVADLGAGFELQAGGSRETRAFAGDGRPALRSVSAALWGSDPNQYFERTGWRGVVRWRPSASVAVDVGTACARERPLSVQTAWNIAGRTPQPEGNLAASAIDARSFGLGVAYNAGGLECNGGLNFHRVDPRDGTPAPDARRRLAEWKLAVRLQAADRLGNRWTARVGGRGHDAPAPAQWREWMGDFRDEGGSLRGWPAATLAGDRGTWASVELAVNHDPWRTLRAPLLRNLNLQPLIFVEWAGAWDQRGQAWLSTPSDVRPPNGWRADVGAGFAKRLDLPLAGPGSRLLLLAARPVGPEATGRPWRVVVGIGL